MPSHTFEHLPNEQCYNIRVPLGCGRLGRSGNDLSIDNLLEFIREQWRVILYHGPVYELKTTELLNHEAQNHHSLHRMHESRFSGAGLRKYSLRDRDCS